MLLTTLLRTHPRTWLKQKAELEAAGPKDDDVWGRLGKNSSAGAKANAPNGKKGKGKVVSLNSRAAATPIAPPKAAPEVEAWIKSRPKGGVKVLSGSEGALGKRAADEQPTDTPASKK
mmetsp:Transcript_14688/g.37980  ORF Transcript_14688/g.37980 Transcript_14688/m.37980 type:complete len:118 (+) Transcript_14688:425-778(+)